MKQLCVVLHGNLMKQCYVPLYTRNFDGLFHYVIIQRMIFLSISHCYDVIHVVVVLQWFIPLFMSCIFRFSMCLCRFIKWVVVKTRLVFDWIVYCLDSFINEYCSRFTAELMLEHLFTTSLKYVHVLAVCCLVCS